MELLHLEPVELARGDRLDQVARLELRVLERVAADERRSSDHLGVQLARPGVVRADRADEGTIGEPVAAQHGILRRRGRDDDVAPARVGRGLRRRLGPVPRRELGGALRPAARDDDPLDRRHGGADRGEL